VQTRDSLSITTGTGAIDHSTLTVAVTELIYCAMAVHNETHRHNTDDDGADFYRAMLCIRGTSHGPVSVRLPVCLSVRPSQVGVLLKRLNVELHKQHHTIAQGL